jgi:hypothetical protein
MCKGLNMQTKLHHFHIQIHTQIAESNDVFYMEFNEILLLT